MLTKVFVHSVSAFIYSVILYIFVVRVKIKSNEINYFCFVGYFIFKKT